MPNRKRDCHICLTRGPKQGTYEALHVWKGNTAPPPQEKRRGGREREYCSGACRQRACRQRNTCKHDLDRLISQSLERLSTSTHQEVHRASWQDELEMHEQLIASLLQQLEQAHQWNDDLESRIDTDRIERDLLLQQIADQEAELTQLRFLLEASSQRHPPRSH